MNGFDCPGPIWNGVCCVGKVEGPAVSAFHSSMDNLGPSIAAEVSSNLVAAGLIPKVTPRANIAKRDSEIASGVTCVGTAIPFGASDYSAQLSRASVKGAGSGGMCLIHSS